MTSHRKNVLMHVFPAALVLCCISLLASSTSGTAGPPLPIVNAFYIKTVPAAYAEQEKFFSSFRNTGIDSVIVELPLTATGFPNTEIVPNLVFLAHLSGLKLHVVVPTRNIPGPLADHDEWEDRAYDLNKDGYQRTGRLDLFNTAAVNYIADVAKAIASYSVDGLVLGPDFTYGPLEGMSSTAASFASRRLQASIDPGDMYKRLGKGPDGRFIQEYSSLFHRWNLVKRDRLITAFEAIRQTARKANRSVSVGVTIPVRHPMPSQADLLTRFSIDLEEFRKRDADYYLTPIEYRDLQEQKHLSYQQALEEVSRVSRSVFSMVKDGRRMIVVLPMTEHLTGKPLRSSEVQEVYHVVRSAGNIGVGLVIKSDTEFDARFLSKLLKK